MNRRMESNLMRLLHGELPPEEARDLRARIERDPALREEYRRLRATWEGLSLPPSAPVPPGFAQRIAARARTEQAGLAWSLAPGWVRATAAAALVIGAAVGAGVGEIWPLGETKPAAVTQQADPQTVETAEAIDGSLAEGYWTAMDELNGGTSESEEALP